MAEPARTTLEPENPAQRVTYEAAMRVEASIRSLGLGDDETFVLCCVFGMTREPNSTFGLSSAREGGRMVALLRSLADNLEAGL